MADLEVWMENSQKQITGKPLAKNIKQIHPREYLVYDYFCVKF